MSTNSNYAPHIFILRALAELQIYFSFFRGVPLGQPGNHSRAQRAEQEKAKLRRDRSTCGEQPGGGPALPAVPVLMRHWFTEALRVCNSINQIVQQ